MMIIIVERQKNIDRGQVLKEFDKDEFWQIIETCDSWHREAIDRMRQHSR